MEIVYGLVILAFGGGLANLGIYTWRNPDEWPVLGPNSKSVKKIWGDGAYKFMSRLAAIAGLIGGIFMMAGGIVVVIKGLS